MTDGADDESRIEGPPGDRISVDQIELIRASGVTVQHIVRVMQSVSSLCDGDATRALIFLTVWLASTQHILNRGAQVEDFDGELYRDDLRRPVSVSAIANSLDLPLETVRRKAMQLTEVGLLKRNPQGRVYVDQGILIRADVKISLVRKIQTMTAILADELRTARGQIAPIAVRPADSETDAPSITEVIRAAD